MRSGGLGRGGADRPPSRSRLDQLPEERGKGVRILSRKDYAAQRPCSSLARARGPALAPRRTRGRYGSGVLGDSRRAGHRVRDLRRRLRVRTAISMSFSVALDDGPRPVRAGTPDDEVGESQNHRAADSTGRPAEGQPKFLAPFTLCMATVCLHRRTYVRHGAVEAFLGQRLRVALSSSRVLVRMRSRNNDVEATVARAHSLSHRA